MILQKCSIWKVAEVFFTEPTKVHFIKEISKKINLAHTSVKVHIHTLVKEGLIEETRTEIFKGYKAKRDTAEFIFHKKISNLISINSSEIIELLKEHYPKSIILFGSYNKGEDIETSDIDIFVDSKKFKVDIEKFEKYLKRGIHILFKEEAGKSIIESINQGAILFGER
ncbi:nucleotidyltransferase domain-containing protein [Candidatus Pacearchaeota archaeon]|jgi:predicted nucleotidyltransferase|nr:nucleotidyltransferase domain-containing protein [Candidatus Pacearchaeota archaeon]